MSWESTTTYYQLINQGIQQRLGGFHSAKLCLLSIDFALIENLQHQGDWQTCGKVLAEAAQQIQRAGADCLLLCTNTMHKAAADIEAAITIPFLHIVDTTAKKLITDKIQCIGLLGTQFTMQQDFYKHRLNQNKLQALVPNQQLQTEIHRIIYQELCLGKILNHSRQIFVEAINELKNAGAQAIVLGCTEIALLIQQQHSSLPLYDTTQIHAEAAIEFALTK